LKPYYEHGGITIYHGDCREVLPTLPVADLLLTDPPYGIDCARAIHCTKPSRPSTYINEPKYEDGGWDVERPPADMFRLMLEKSRDRIIWGGNYFADLLPASRGWLFWDKLFEHTTNFSHGELAWTSLEQRLLKFTYSSKAETAGGKYRVHPTQKPVALMAWCIRMVPNGSVLDPFMGAGAAIVAAKDLGRRAIGIEIEERYCEIAAKRLAQETLFGPDQEPAA
jgi:DNA modification methylase